MSGSRRLTRDARILRSPAPGPARSGEVDSFRVFTYHEKSLSHWNRAFDMKETLMKRAILAVVLIAALGAAAALACVSDPQGRLSFIGGEPACIGGGHGCVECDSYDQSGDYLTCYYSTGVTYCFGVSGGRPYTI